MLVAHLRREAGGDQPEQEVMVFTNGLVVAYDLDESGVRVGRHSWCKPENVVHVVDRLRTLTVASKRCVLEIVVRFVASTLLLSSVLS